MKDATTAKHAAVRGVDYGTTPGGTYGSQGTHLHIPADPTTSTFEDSLDEELFNVRELLLEKNAAYGDSALNPVNALSSASATEQIRVRMDDKLSRMVRGHEYANEDTLLDFVGYYFLLKIAEGRA